MWRRNKTPKQSVNDFSESPEITDSNDLVFLRMMRGASFDSTVVLPSGAVLSAQQIKELLADG